MPVRINDKKIETMLADLDMAANCAELTKSEASSLLRGMLLDLKEARAAVRAQHGWVVQLTRQRKTVFLGVKEGRPYWTPTARIATHFARDCDARGIADLVPVKGVTVGEYYWS